MRPTNPAPVKLDAPFYTEEELDALYEQDPIQALKISREQTLLRKQLEAAPRIDPNASMPTKEALQLVLEEARRILLRDGGDLEFVALEGALLRVRLKGNCVGCPRATLDLRNVVEKLVCSRFPQISAVKNIY